MTVTKHKERPILFSGPMVEAILDGRKTQTRRVIKPQPDWKTSQYTSAFVTEAWQSGFIDVKCPYGDRLDRLWVREAWCRAVDPVTSKLNGKAHYRADGQEVLLDDGDGFSTTNKDGSFASPWKPSIHMPRWASRITLEVVEIRVEHLSEITFDSALSEGVDDITEEYWVKEWADLWDSINAKRGFGWGTNPWVWVVEFKKVDS